jgi:hypothetical protein
MAKRISDAEWRGDLKDGAGTLRLGSGAFEGKYSYKSRFEDGPGTNPEELIAAVFLDGSIGGAVAEGPRTDKHPYESYRRFRPGRGRFRDLPHYTRNRRPSSRHRLRHIRAGRSGGQSGVPCLEGSRRRGNQSGGEAPIAGPMRLSIPVLGIDLSLMAPILGAYTLFCQLRMSTESPCWTGRIHR